MVKFISVKFIILIKRVYYREKRRARDVLQTREIIYIKEFYSAADPTSFILSIFF